MDRPIDGETDIMNTYINHCYQDAYAICVMQPNNSTLSFSHHATVRHNNDKKISHNQHTAN